jgi:hypothetical protein
MDTIAQDLSTGKVVLAAIPSSQFCDAFVSGAMDKILQSWHPYVNEPLGKRLLLSCLASGAYS